MRSLDSAHIVEMSFMTETINSTVAIVDDDPRVRVSIGDLLESAGFTAKTFLSAEDFLDSGDQSKIGCLITDMRMPGMNGLQLLEKIKQAQPELPVVIVTGHQDSDIQARALQEGAVGFFYKPFCDVELLHIVADASNRFKAIGNRVST